MRWKRREKSPRVLADYRQVSDAVHARRAARESGVEPPALDPAEAERLARVYTPERHLRTMDEKARRLVEDARHIPRTHEPEGSFLPTVSDREKYIVFLVAMALVGFAPLANLIPGETANAGERNFYCLLTFVSSLLLLVASVHCRTVAPRLVWVGYLMAALQLLALLGALLRSGAV